MVLGIALWGIYGALCSSSFIPLYEVVTSMIMDTEKYISNQQKREKAERAKEDRRINKLVLKRIDHLTKKKGIPHHLWIVEYVDYDKQGKKRWFPTADKIGDFEFFETRKEALEAKDIRFHGHEKDLRVIKYVRA